MPDAAVLDAVLQRYGWDYWTFMSQPEEVIQELMVVMKAEAEAQGTRDRRAKGKTGGPGAVPTNTPDLLRQASAAGLPLPPKEFLPAAVREVRADLAGD